MLHLHKKGSQNTGHSRAWQEQTGQRDDNTPDSAKLFADENSQAKQIYAGSKNTQIPEMGKFFHGHPMILLDEGPLNQERCGSATAKRLQANRCPDAKKLPSSWEGVL